MTAGWRCWLDGQPAGGDAAAQRRPGWLALAYPSADAEDSGRDFASPAAASEHLLLQLQSLVDGPLGHGVGVVGISRQSMVVQAALSERLGLRIPLVSDPYGTLARSLGLRVVSLGERHWLLPTLLICTGREELARLEGFEAISLNMRGAVEAAFPQPHRPPATESRNGAAGVYAAQGSDLHQKVASESGQ